MARFDKLEFGGQQGSAPTDAPALKVEETDWLGEAERQRRNGQYENALRFYSRALEADRSLVKGWFGQVQMLILLDELPERHRPTRSNDRLEIVPKRVDARAATRP